MKLFDRLLTFVSIQVGILGTLAVAEMFLQQGGIDAMFVAGFGSLSTFLIGAAYLSDDSPASPMIPGILAAVELMIGLQSFAIIMYSHGAIWQDLLLLIVSVILAIVVTIACFKRLNYKPVSQRPKNNG